MHGEGSMLVTAGPGSGKTLVLTGRILYLTRERQIPPGRILVITFTRESARTMQNRYYEMADPCARSGQVSFGTFHSFFYQILKSSERYTQCRIIRETDRQKILYPLLRDIKVRLGDTSPYFEPVSLEEISRVLSAVSYGKNTGDALTARERLPQPWRACYEEILRGYEGQKEQRRQLDLDDLLTLTQRELERDESLLRRWQRRYSHVLVDEFQDCDPVQYEILKKICPPGGNLFAVGDDDQSIYAFRGADADIMRRFREDYGAGERGLSHVVLGCNYRCAPEVVQASAAVIASNRRREPKRLISAREPGGSVRLLGFAGGREERNYVLSQCRDRTGKELDRWAVLFRTNALLSVFGAELLQAGIPFVTAEKVTDLYEHFIVRDVADYFRAACGCRERSLFLRLWNRPRLCVGREALDGPEVDFGRIRQFYSRAPYEDPAAVRDLEQFERKLGTLERFSPQLGLTFVRKGFGYEDYLRRRAGDNRELLESWLEVLDWLAGDCASCGSLGEWLLRRERRMRERRSESENRGSRRNAPSGGLHILTMHAAKGSEYDRVFLMDVNEGNIPRRRRGEELSETLLEEERRLFYVAMTRARDSLELLYQTGTRERPRQPSAFLHPLGKR